MLQIIGVPRPYLEMGTQAILSGGPVRDMPGHIGRSGGITHKYFRKQRFYRVYINFCINSFVD